MSDVRTHLELALEKLLVAATHAGEAHKLRDVRAQLPAIRAAPDAAKLARVHLNQAGVLAKTEAEKQGRLF